MLQDYNIFIEQDLQATANRSGTIGPGGPVAPPVETPYGQSVNPEDAPAAISQAVASLPPEQMYSLMKDMKEVIMVCFSYLV